MRASDVAHAFFTLIGNGSLIERSARAQTVAAEGDGWFVRWYEDALFYLQILHRVVHPDVMGDWRSEGALQWTGMFDRVELPDGYTELFGQRDGTPIRGRAWMGPLHAKQRAQANNQLSYSGTKPVSYTHLTLPTMRTV